MNPLETYFNNLYQIYSTGAGVKETSYYGSLETLLNEVGNTLKPKIRCVINLKNQGAGIPDGGLFSANQFVNSSLPLTPRERGKGGEGNTPFQGIFPERGVIEIKSTKEDINKIINSDQVNKYWAKYRQVLVTNYREFILIGQDSNGNKIELERYQLAENETEFWQKVAHPRAFVKEDNNRFLEYLKRVMLQSAFIASPQDLAWFLASYARDAKSRLEQQTDLTALYQIRSALEDALGVKFEGEKGDQFFQSTLIQTLFYGIFSAWVLWHKQTLAPVCRDVQWYVSTNDNVSTGGLFDWKTAAFYLHVPMIQILFEQIARPSKLKQLDLIEVLDWTGAALNRVNREEFFTKFNEGEAVQYFYEPFLEAFDPILRKELGVWYTPPEIIKYMVNRVDTVLKEELKIPDGLANENVYILDPCCGTGAYLVEVLQHIANTLEENGEGALSLCQVKEAAKNRVFGFEILTAPYIIAHLQLGLILSDLGVPLREENERVGVYLTNALTGWLPPNEEAKRKIKQLELQFPELNKEREAADEIKQGKPILVILGNPPYNAYAETSPTEEDGLVEVYKQGLTTDWGIKKYNLDDLYVRFFRLAERCISESTGKGIVCYISNFSYLSSPSFVVMRQYLINNFDQMWIDSLNGDLRQTGYLTPDGQKDPSVFTTFYSAGIKVGTAINLMVKKELKSDHKEIYYQDFWGVNKKQKLLASLAKNDLKSSYEIINPQANNKYLLKPSKVATCYLEWLKLTDLSEISPLNGPIERRGNSLIVMKSDQANLELLSSYFDPNKDDLEISVINPRWLKSSGEFKAEKTRRNLLSNKVKYDVNKIKLYPFKPFDLRLAYLDAEIQPLFSRPSPELLQLAKIPHNCFLISRDTADKYSEGPPFYWSNLVCDYDSMSGHARHFPILITHKIPKKSQKNHQELFNTEEFSNTEIRANLSAKARQYLTKIGLKNPDENAETACLIWYHALAVGYSPDYLTENADGIRQDFPRIPLPNSQELLVNSAKLGQEIANLLNLENSQELPIKLPKFGLISRVNGGQLNPENGELAITVGWGHGGKNNVTMPGKGKLIDRHYTDKELEAIAQSSGELKLSEEDILAQLGKTTCDIYLNEVAYWSNVPINVWNYTIGGYQVIKKWLSYREEKLLGRPLQIEEVKEVYNIIKRICTIILLQHQLNSNYQLIKDNNQ